MASPTIFALARNQYRVSLNDTRGTENWNNFFSSKFPKVNSVGKCSGHVILIRNHTVIWVIWGHFTIWTKIERTPDKKAHFILLHKYD